MTESSNIARPYARAVFELAPRGDLAGWGYYLDLLAAIAADASVIALVNNPRVSTEQLENFFLEMIWAVRRKEEGGELPPDVPGSPMNSASEAVIQIWGGQLGKRVVNFLKLLVRNGRIGILPDIVAAYAVLRAEAENTIAAEMTTAVELEPRQQSQFAEALQGKLGRKVELTFAVDQDLVGGAVVRAGDWVIDGSVRAQLEQLVGALRA